MRTRDLIFLVCLLGFIIYLFIKRRHKYWDQRNVPCLKPKNLIMGNTAMVLLNKVPLVKYHAKIYEELAPHKFGGYFNFLTPVLVIRDPDLIRNVLTKDFHYFMNRGSGFIDENEPLTLHLFNLSGERWKITRTKLTPTFTSGKMKIMFDLMNECAQELGDIINKATENEEALEVKEIMSRFTTDVISSCVFGLQANSIKNPDSIFRIMGKKVFNTTFRSRFLGFFSSFVPGLRRVLKLSFFDKDVKEFFSKMVIDTVKYREENDIHRNDFLNLLITLKHETENSNNTDVEEKKFEFTDNLMIAQCFVFFVAGFETSSGTLTFALYEVAKNEKIQNKLFNEIDSVFQGNELTYERLQSMSYLDQVVSETLRIYPILPFLIRVCNERYQLNEHLFIEKGTRIIIPVLGLQTDPLYYNNPNEFNPENFSKEAKTKRHHYTYLPFGEGPRNCIGMRFGLMQVKLGLAVLIKNYEVTLSPKMDGPLLFNKTSFLASVEGGVWLTFKKRVR